MSELNSIRMVNFVDNNGSVITGLTGALNQMENLLPEALRQLAYIVQNPDNIGDAATYIAATSAETASLIAKFEAVEVLVEAYKTMRDDPTQIDAVLTANGLSIADMSTQLLRK